MTAGVEGTDIRRGDNRRLILAALIPLVAFVLQWIFWNSLISDAEGRFIEFNDAFAALHKFRNKDESQTRLHRQANG